MSNYDILYGTSNGISRHTYVQRYRNLVDGVPSTLRNLGKTLDGGEYGDIKVANIPILEMMADTTADLVFSEPAEINVTKSSGKKRLDYIISKNELHAEIREAFKAGNIEGGYAGKINITPDTPDGREVPIVTFEPEDRFIFRYKGRELIEADFITDIRYKDNEEYRLVETHSVGYITNKLYISTNNGTVMTQISLDSIEETRGLSEVIETNIEVLTVVYFPANKNSESKFFGKSDFYNLEAIAWYYTKAVLRGDTLLDLSEPKIMVSKNMVGKNGKLPKGRQVYVWEQKHRADGPGSSGGEKFMEFIQPNFEANNITLWQKTLFEYCLLFGGVSPQLTGYNTQGASNSAAQEKLKMLRSILKASRKALIWETRLSKLLYAAMLMDQFTFGFSDEYGNSYVKQGFNYPGGSPEIPTVKCADGFPIDRAELVAIAKEVKSNQLASDETCTAIAFPDWDEDRIQLEMKKIKENAENQNAGLRDILSASTPIINPINPAEEQTNDTLEVAV